MKSELVPYENGEVWCLSHDPNRRAEHAAKSARGGFEANRTAAPKTLAAILSGGPPETAAQARDLAAASAHAVAAGKLAASRGTVIAGLCRVFLAALEQTTFEAKLTDMARQAKHTTRVTDALTADKRKLAKELAAARAAENAATKAAQREAQRANREAKRAAGLERKLRDIMGTLPAGAE